MEACWFNVDASGKGQSVVDGFGLNLYLKTGAVKVRDHIKVTFVWRVMFRTIRSHYLCGYIDTVYDIIKRVRALILGEMAKEIVSDTQHLIMVWKSCSKVHPKLQMKYSNQNTS